MFLVLIALGVSARDYHESVTGNDKNDGSTRVNKLLKYGSKNKFYLCVATTKIVMSSKNY